MSVTKIIKHDQFIIDGKYRTAVMDLAINVAILPARTILGKSTPVTKAAVAAVADGAGSAGANTGTGTVVLDVTTPLLDGVVAGSYSLKCISAVTTDPAADAVFEVYAPSGAYLGKTDAGVGGDTWAKQIKFVITDMATAGDEVAFAVGDGFVIAVTATAGTPVLIAWDPDGTDGREIPYGILKEDAPIDVAAQPVSVFIEGLFNADLALVPEGADVDDAFDGLREKGIIMLHQVDADRNPVIAE